MAGELALYPRDGRRYWGAKFVALVLGIIFDAASIGVAAALSQNVTATAQGAVLAGVIIAVPLWVHGRVFDQLRERAEPNPTDESVVGLVIFGVMSIPGSFVLLPIASAVMPGFDVHGFSAYVLTWILIFVVGFAFYSPYLAVRLLRRTRVRQSQ